jgi:hypothetical protein
MSNKNLTIGVLIAIVIAIGGYFFPTLNKVFGTISGTDITATHYTQLLVDNGIQVTANGINIVSGGLNNASGLLASNGSQTAVSRSTTFNTASTTNCSVASPFTASSTLLNFVIRMDTSSTSAQVMTLATTTNGSASASSSPFYTVPSIAAGAQAYISWASGVNNGLVAPGGAVVATSQGNTGTFSNTGVCTATFLQP